MAIKTLNHIVLNVGDVTRTAGFYRDVLGFTIVIESPKARFAFLRAPESENHHDLALFAVRNDPEGAVETRRGSYGGGAVGLHHFAWEVPTLEELDAVRDKLDGLGCLMSVQDHGCNKSVYGTDPDGLDFEVMWLVPAHLWGDKEHEAIAQPMDIPEELARYAELMHQS